MSPVVSPVMFWALAACAVLLDPASQEKQACTRNLKLLYDAIQAYQADHKDLPNWLSDLVPQYLPDTNALICPVCRLTIH